MQGEQKASTAGPGKNMRTRAVQRIVCADRNSYGKEQ